MIWLKICGITNIADARDAVSLGANALGFVFAPSRRQVTPEEVRQITLNIPETIEKIGVFVNMNEQKVKDIALFSGLTGLQFHGEESPKYCENFSGCQVTKALRVDAQRGWESICPYLDSRGVSRILLDTFVTDMPGGTGKTFPWTLAAQRNWKKPMILAGGITPENVTRAIREGRPWGIDVSSGVERAPGNKDKAKMSRLISVLRKAEG